MVQLPHMFPGWLLRAWTAGELVEATNTEGIFSKSSVRESLLTKPDRLTLAIWSIILNQIYEAVVKCRSIDSLRFEISVSDLVSKVGTVGKSNCEDICREALANFFQIRLVGADKFSNTLRATAIFPGDILHKWTDEGVETFQVDLSSQSIEALIGVAEGYSDHLRKIQLRTNVLAYVGDMRPIALKYPAWLEFNTIERSIYLKLEYLMQVELPLIHLEGIFACSIEDLFEWTNFKFGNLGDQLKIIGAIGRKMVDHGIIISDPSESFYACDSGHVNERSPSLIWGIDQTRRPESIQRNFFGKIFEILRRSKDNEQTLHLWSALAPNARSIGIEIDKYWQTIGEVPGGIYGAAPNLVMQLHNLFFEFSLRRPTLSNFPISEELRSSNLFEVCKLQGNLLANFRKFVEIFSDENNSRDLIDEAVKSSIVFDPNGVSMHPPLGASNLEVSGFELGPIVLKSSPAPIDVAILSDQQPSVENGLKTELKSRLLSLSESKMIRIAHDELETMFKSDQRAFSEIKERYFESLDANQRNLIFDFQRRMKKGQFDQQLKQRLVRFMVANPGSWKSSQRIIQ